LGDHKWGPRNETEKAEQYFFSWGSERVKRTLKPTEMQKFIIDEDCVKRRLIEKKTLELRLASHPEARTVLAPCFHSCMMDICYGFKGQTYKRSRAVIKLYVLVIICLLTGATNIMALEGIETQDVCAALD